MQKTSLLTDVTYNFSLMAKFYAILICANSAQISSNFRKRVMLKCMPVKISPLEGNIRCFRSKN